jgi:D-glycero-D-manno-heptose 1,7-bisphosphate phosphatase
LRGYYNKGNKTFDRAIFLDRDGVLNRDVGHPHLEEQYKPFECMPESMARLSKLDAYIILITNQSGIATNMYDVNTFKAFNGLIIKDVEAAGGRINAIYYCPHYDWYNLPEGVERCRCSKPGPGMLEEAASDFELDLGNSVIIGDNYTDIGAGINAGMGKTILVTTGSWYRNGNYREEPLREKYRPDYTAHSLHDATQKVIELFK